MEMRRLGRTGPDVSIVGLGCSGMGGRLDFEASRALIGTALDLGVTFLDTADVYLDGAAEEMLGRALEGRRQNFAIATKFGQSMGCSRQAVIESAEASLRRLRTDYIDLYQIHWPDPATPIEVTLSALQQLVQDGKVLHVGCSNFSARDIEKADCVARDAGLPVLVACQNPYSLLERDIEADLLPAIRAAGAALIPYFPLARGLLTGRFSQDKAPAEGSSLLEYDQFAKRFLTSRNFEMIEDLKQFCEDNSCTMVELAFSWLRSRSEVGCIIAGASTPLQLIENARSISWKLSAEGLAQLEQLTVRADAS